MEKNKVKIITKSVSSEDNTNGIRKGEIDLINKFTRRKLKIEEVYVFSVILCDNEVDRQNERFSDDALEKLAELFVGKTGIMDHEVKSNNQTARIFSCEVRTYSNKLTSVGSVYKCLVARAYMPKTQKNEEIIMAIDSGIKKEVSINCAVETVRCCICGLHVKINQCQHIKGTTYRKGNHEILCHHILDNPVDAYEWSFVVVPAQKKAGVIKAFNPTEKGGEKNIMDVLKKLSLAQQPITLYPDDANELHQMIKSLQQKAKVGEDYFKELKNEIVKLSMTAQSDINPEIMTSVVEKMSVHELKLLRDAYKKRILKNSCVKPQLSPYPVRSTINSEFKI